MKTYYVDAILGDDNRPGTDRNKGWRSLARVSSHTFEPGDAILLRRNCTWNEPLRLKGKGTAEAPIRVSAYGEGPQPRIVVKDVHGVSADEAITHWHINSLEVSGPEPYSPRGKEMGKASGITFFQEEVCEGLKITECVVHDFPGAGIAVHTTGDPRPVFKDLAIEHCRVWNVGTGITTGAGPTYGTEFFPNFRVAHCTVNDTATDGITPFCGRDGVIEHCTAYRTGIGITKRSPVAIWYAWALRCTIQYCEAYDNHTAGNQADGGGFDIDGGCTDCVMQYNFSHDNDGAGYLICSWDPENWPIGGIVCRFNVSINDGLANDYGSITFWQAWDVKAYNNTCVIRAASPVKFIAGKDSAGNPNDCRNLDISNNIFYVDSTEDRPLIKSDQDIKGHTFKNNLYYRTGDGVRFELPGGDLRSVEEFAKLVGSEGEKCADPLFAALKFQDLHLKAASPALGAGLKIENRGKHDFYKVAFAEDAPAHIGAASQATRLIPRPMKK